MAKKRKPSGLTSVDNLADLATVTLDDYVSAASDYVLQSRSLTDGQRKAGQIRLSAGLARALAAELRERIPEIQVVAGERRVAGALRIVQADVSEVHELDGLRLGVEIKPVNLAVGRAIWNRFGDLRTFAVNLHLKFPFSVVGGILAIPTSEDVKAKNFDKANPSYTRKSTRHLIARATQRLARAGDRRSEGDAPHLLEAVAVVVYDPATASLDDALPPLGSGLRWDEFVARLTTAYRDRFEITEQMEPEDEESDSQSSDE